MALKAAVRKQRQDVLVEVDVGLRFRLLPFPWLFLTHQYVRQKAQKENA